VVPVGEDLVLLGQEGATGIHQVDARQAVFLGDLLGAQVLLHRHRVVGAALHGGIVGHDHALGAIDPADAGDHAGRGRIVVVHPVGGQLAEFEKAGAGIKQMIDPVAGQQLAAGHMLGPGRLTTAEGHLRSLLAQVGHDLAHLGRVGLELGRSRVDAGFDDAHVGFLAQAVSENSSRPISMRRISLVPAPIS
jgi:hypothetical protein